VSSLVGSNVAVTVSHRAITWPITMPSHRCAICLLHAEGPLSSLTVFSARCRLRPSVPYCGQCAAASSCSARARRDGGATLFDDIDAKGWFVPPNSAPSFIEFQTQGTWVSAWESQISSFTSRVWGCCDGDCLWIGAAVCRTVMALGSNVAAPTP